MEKCEIMDSPFKKILNSKTVTKFRKESPELLIL